MKGFYSGVICFLDSGIGGLTLLAECIKRLPDARYAYFADNDNVPYGGKTREELIEIADGAFKSIAALNPAAAVLGCNTLTAVCAAHLRKKFAFPIIGIQPAVKPAAAFSRSCTVLATPATANSESVARLIEIYGKNVTEVVACPNLAAYIEQNIFDLKKNELDALLPDLHTDAVVLGCTHYVFIKNYVKKRYKCPVFDGNEGTARRLMDIVGKFDHFEVKSPSVLYGGTAECRNYLKNVVFSGGNEVKNRRVLEFLLRG